MRGLLRLAIAALLVGMAAQSHPALAQGKFEARYTLSMAGFSIGKTNWSAEINAADYTTTASGRASGLFSVLISGEASVTTRGIVKDNKPQAVSYASQVNRDDEKTASRMTLDNGNVKDVKVEGPPPEGDRVPITDAHKQNVIDPLTAFLLPAGATDPLAPDACQRVLPVFDARRRYDLTLSFRRADSVKSVTGYQGPALVCTMVFKPIAGHRTSSPLLKYLSEGRDMEVWFVPIAGTKLLAPVRVSVSSMIGNMVLQAEQFVTDAAANISTQRKM